MTTATVGTRVSARTAPVWKSTSAVIPIRSKGTESTKRKTTSKEVTLFTFTARGAIRFTRAAKLRSGKESTRTLPTWPKLMRPMSLSGTLATTSSPCTSSTIDELVAPALADAVVVGVTNEPGSVNRWLITPLKGARTINSLRSTWRCCSRSRAASTEALSAW